MHIQLQRVEDARFWRDRLAGRRRITGHEVGRLGRVGRIANRRQNRIDVDDAGRQAQIAVDARLPQLAANAQIGVDPDVPHLVVDDLEVGRLHRQVHAADLKFVNGQVAGH